jgi:hypothetical protein
LYCIVPWVPAGPIPVATRKEEIERQAALTCKQLSRLGLGPDS